MRHDRPIPPLVLLFVQRTTSVWLRWLGVFASDGRAGVRGATVIAQVVGKRSTWLAGMQAKSVHGGY